MGMAFDHFHPAAMNILPFGVGLNDEILLPMRHL
jgi:hypothetical protein